MRASETFVMLADLLGKPITGVTSFPTVRDPKALVQALAERIKALLVRQPMTQERALDLAASYAERKKIPVVYAEG